MFNEPYILSMNRFIIIIYKFFFFFEKQLQHAANPAARTLSPLNPQALCTWGGVNSATRPLVIFFFF